MATWPTYARFELSGMTEQRASALLRTATEAGPPKQRRNATRVMVTLRANVLFLTAANYASFLTWFGATVKNGQDWFDLPHPRTGATVQARFVGGEELGAAEYLTARGVAVRQPVVLEYWSA